MRIAGTMLKDQFTVRSKQRGRYYVSRSRYYTDPHRMRGVISYCGVCNRMSEKRKTNTRCHAHMEAAYHV